MNTIMTVSDITTQHTDAERFHHILQAQRAAHLRDGAPSLQAWRSDPTRLQTALIARRGAMEASGVVGIAGDPQVPPEPVGPAGGGVTCLERWWVRDRFRAALDGGGNGRCSILGAAWSPSGDRRPQSPLVVQVPAATARTQTQAGSGERERTWTD